jgi:hypothetical protein
MSSRSARMGSTGVPFSRHSPHHSIVGMPAGAFGAGDAYATMSFPLRGHLKRNAGVAYPQLRVRAYLVNFLGDGVHGGEGGVVAHLSLCHGSTTGDAV